jgi:signal transduction histidine kinase
MEDLFQGLFISILIIGILAMLGSLILAYKFSSSITQPIRQTVNLAAEYGKGNLDASLNMDRQDEIGELVISLIKLSQEIKALIEEKVANENLIMMGEFASYIIHDLKNPLSGIHLLADGMDRKISKNDALKRYSTEILLATQKLHTFVERTLDIARWNRLNLQPIKIPTLINEAIQVVNHQSIAIHKEFDKNMPVINGDYQLLVMAVKNLFNNALEAIDGDGQLDVETEWQKKAFIKISDNGNGIPEDQLSSIFRPFFSMKDQGHGLGLAMVKKAIILHHGKIEVQSQIGKGTTFTISLPRNL